MNNDLPVSLEFNDQNGAYAFIHLTELGQTLPNLHEYYIVPTYTLTGENAYVVDGYSFVHRSHVATEKDLERKYGKGNF